MQPRSPPPLSICPYIYIFSIMLSTPSISPPNQTCESAPMEVRVQRSRILFHGEPHSLPSEVPLTIFDRFAANLHVAVIFAFTAPMPTNAALVEGLSNTLPYFPTLTAQLGYSPRLRRPCLLLSGPSGGALVVESIVSSRLSDHLPLEPSPDFQKLHPSPIGAAQLFQVQINRFACGGVVIAATAHHRAADGQSMSTFFAAWAGVVRGVPVDRLHLPVYNQSWLVPRHPPRLEFNHWGLDFAPTLQPHRVNVDPHRIANILLRFPGDFLRKLKTEVEKYTTFETLLAHVWRKMTIARGLQDWEHTLIRVSVNGRARLKPPVPSEFFGNLVLNAYPNANVRHLLTGGLAEAARIVHEAIAEIGDSYFRSFIDFGEVHAEEELVPDYDLEGNLLSPVLEVDSWLRFRFEEVDFGAGGELRAFLPTWVPMEGLVVFVPGMGEGGGGGVDVLVAVLCEQVELLREIAYTLD